MRLLLAAALAAVLFAGCVQPGEQNARLACEQLCSQAKAAGTSLANGPCLGQLSTQGLSDWVCDVAHSPRQDVDNLVENQCAAYRSGAATHFVEVDEQCTAFRAQ
ncbi:MAG: hypothetical protein AB1626_01225 [Candidatus Micrarchaeota archaeon]